MDARRAANDGFGEIEVRPGAMWGPQTQRALVHFDIGSPMVSPAERMPSELLRALVLLKGIAAEVNARLGRLDAGIATAIAEAATGLLGEEGAGGDGDAALPSPHFPLSLWQSGSGTQTHMNVNEVLARLAGYALGPAVPVHPNDHVNLGQSSNDMVPSAMHVAARLAWPDRLGPTLERLVATLRACAARHAGQLKLGRTHLQDAVPMTAADEIGAWASALDGARAGVEATLPALEALAVGGTAVGSGLNAHPEFAGAVCRELRARTGVVFRPAADRYAALAGHEAMLAFSGALQVLAVAALRMANDLRLLASGPRGGLAEYRLPANEPGSSIMPGKVNPTQCEALAMVCVQAMGNHAAVAYGAAGGHLQLNTMKPLIAANVLRSVRLLADALTSFERHTAQGLEADGERMDEWLSRSLMLVTALTPHIGYDRAAAIAHRAHESGRTLREAALEMGVSAEDYARWADPRTMLGPRAG